MCKNNERIKVLLIEDSTADAFLISEFLEEIEDFVCDHEHCGNLNEGLSLLDSKRFDIVLIDYHLPDSTGVLQIQEVFAKYSDVPFIVLTGLNDRTVSLDAINRGAKDYLIKGEFNSSLLHRSILYALERKKTEEENVVKILAAQDKEKERIARDVHDTLGQNLSSAVLQIQNIKRHLQNESEEVKESIELALKCINEAIAESRGISRSLMPQTVQKFGLASGIESILLSLANNSKIEFEFDNELEFTRFDQRIELAFFRIAQESINNILKYSKAEQAKINLCQSGKVLKLQIEDNGCGFDMNQAANQKGIGLESIRTRAKAIGAKLELSSQLNRGTMIRIRTKI